MPEPPTTASPPAARRTVHVGDGLAWLTAAALPADHAVVTSLPDLSELPALGEDGWRPWFLDAAERACRAVADEAVAIFYQTDVKREGRWVDKAFLVELAAERAGSGLLWHKVVCRVAPGTTTFGRPAYAHLLCVSRALRLTPGQASPDVLPVAGAMTWARAMPLEACAAAARFLVAHTRCRTVVDPFCGLGSMLAVANAHGLDAVGVELSRKRAERARALVLPALTPRASLGRAGRASRPR
ncbi:MAG TPA: SAM-dependent methyltransferase [Anaeromyxobacter sp.]|nr:SAM-dependent methyltransferase [Anaeromyxobacter sp.]